MSNLIFLHLILWSNWLSVTISCFKTLSGLLLSLSL